MIKCKMKIDRIMFPRDKEVSSGDFCIFTAKIIQHIEGEKPVVDKTYNNVKLKGEVPPIKSGYELDIVFDNPEVNKYGTTYNVTTISKEFNPENPKELKDYLNLICGATLAKEFMKLENPYELLKNRNDEELLKVKGIGKKKLYQIYNKIESFADNTEAYVKLEPLGLTRKQIKDICSEVGGATNAIEVCFKNPYSLVGKIKGMGFKTVDEIAINCGMNPFSPVRIKTAIKYALKEAGENGRSYLLAPQLLQEIRKIVTIEFYTLDSIVKDMLVNEELVLSNDGMKVALPQYIRLEQNIAKEIERIRDAKSNIKVPENWLEIIREIEKKQGWCHTEEQLNGIEMSLKNNILVVSGKAGSGKSTITNAMAEVLKDYDISLCCLSAKASQRLREVTGMDASTIHKLLACDKDESPKVYSDIVIIDEASMVSGTLFLKLLRAIGSGSKVIILGDDGQLTAIGDCSVFSDLMVSKKVPHIELTKIHRQAEKSAIITKSIDFRNQVPICDRNFSGHTIMGELQDLELFVLHKDMLLHQIKEKFLEDLRATNDILEVQVITPLKTRGILSIHNINLELQALVNPRIGKYFEGVNKTKIFVGDKVINLKNNYDAKDEDENAVGIWNGSIGIVERIEEDEVIINFTGIGKIVVEKENFNNINLAYAISCHSSQGSQWKRVICGFDMSAYVLLNVEIIYTALTRASEHCSLIIERKALDYSARTVEQKTKQTLLPAFISNPT